MKACLRNSVGLITNVSADSIQLEGYSEDFLDTVGATLDEYKISSTMNICESIGGQALIALMASIGKEAYDHVLSNCLGTNATLAIGSFTSTQPTTLPSSISISDPERTVRQLWSPRQLRGTSLQRTLLTNNGMNFAIL